ncbi:helix-turn-helix transcriptional regulator [Streptococcus porcinus]|uniref:Helix-turn-helix transcriptional regulator n=1 Tax=Streptococcus porcinus TaxID=1340 RepID=A0A7W0AS27_STRPO|nr:helix-turn-helix transcriptional regulator [Streptococcus porcinus]MBA2795681.1 helix-turn-helix transcriptional regulator [Streptococcus porcinus]
MKNNLQELRKANKLSQAELAEAMSVTRQTIISLERGRYNASLELAFKLARYFHLTIEDIFYFEESREEE